MDIRKIKKLIEMLQDSDLTEIKVQEGEESVRIVRESAQSLEVKTSSLSRTPVSAPSENNEVSANESGLPIKSPIVGTFYRKPSPDAEPFVEVGQMIKKGDTVCIIEAMKMMNQVKSQFEGKIISINVGDGEPVEFDQELISIEES